jgi:hypothetical protein
VTAASDGAGDPHLLRPDHLPTPFTADEIRDGCQPGRTVRSLVEEAGQPPYIHVTRFVGATPGGAKQEAWDEDLDGTRRGDPLRRHSTWLDFQSHASFPAASTQVSEEEMEIPAGRFEMLRYTQHEGSVVRSFWFARSAPGMPLRYEEWDGENLVYRSTALENVPADPPSG